MDASLMAWEHYVPVAEEGVISDTVDGGNNETSQLKGPKALSVVQRLDTLILGEHKSEIRRGCVCFFLFFQWRFFSQDKLTCHPNSNRKLIFPSLLREAIVDGSEIPNNHLGYK